LPSDEAFDVSSLPQPPDRVSIILLGIKTAEREDRDGFLKAYHPQPVPGTIIGPHNYPTVSFSTGWRVPDIDTGSVFNLTVAHGIRDAKPPKYTWSQIKESTVSPKLDCPL